MLLILATTAPILVYNPKTINAVGRSPFFDLQLLHVIHKAKCSTQYAPSPYTELTHITYSMTLCMSPLFDFFNIGFRATKILSVYNIYTNLI